MVLDFTFKARKGKSSGFAYEQELQEFKIKFADSEQQLTVWKKKFEELGFVRDGLEDELEMKDGQVSNLRSSFNTRLTFALVFYHFE